MITQKGEASFESKIFNLLCRMFSRDPRDNIIFMFEKGVRFIKCSSKAKSELLQGKGSRFLSLCYQAAALENEME